MLFNKSSSKDTIKTAYDLKKAAKRRKRIIRDIVFCVILGGAVIGIGTCVQCIGRKSDINVLRHVADVSDFSVVFFNGEAILSWVDPPDIFLDHIEIQFRPDGRGVEKVAPRAEKYVISGLENGKEYFFTVQAVDRWGNKSDTVDGGTGKAFKWQGSVIKGTPVVEEMTLSWTNFPDAQYDHIEISYNPDEKPLRIHRGVESKTIVNLTNGLEYTFSIMAVDAQGNRRYLNDAAAFVPDHATSPDFVVGRPSGGQVTLEWKEGYNALLDYVEVVYTPEGETPVTVAKGAQTETFTGLSDISDYEFTVYAVNTDGHRQPYRRVKLLTPAIPVFNGRDVRKMAIRAQPVAGQVTFEWTDPEMPNFDHVAIIYEPDGAEVPITVEKGAQTQTVACLSDSIEYRFLVYGVDTDDNNRVITGVTYTTPQLPELKVKPVGGKATLVWTNPDDPNLDYVRVFCSPGEEMPVRVRKGIEAYSFTGLSDNQEYEFKVTAVNTKRNVYAIARANVVVTRLPIVIGTPVNNTLSLAWFDPVDIKIERIEILHSPGGVRAQTVPRGMESHTFTNLANNTEYAFTIYALDYTGNKYPVRSARIYDPNAVYAYESDSSFQTGDVNALIWRSVSNTTFGESTVYALSFGTAANGTTRWVAGGGEGRMAYSNDYGLSWIQVGDSTFGSFPVNAISYGNGRWVAVGKSGKIAWSTNATLWNAIKKTHFSNSQAINTVAYGNGHWIAGGSNGIIILSDDNAVNWRRISTNVFGKSAVNTIIFHEGRWMAGGAAGKIAYSDDNGLTWTAVESTAFGSGAINVIVYDQNRWIAGGYGQSTIYSEDGITWKSLTRPFFILCMGFNGNRWVVGGQEGRMAWSGDGGKTWIVDEQGHNLFGSNWVQAIATGRAPNGRRRWFSGGQNGKIIYADEQ